VRALLEILILQAQAHHGRKETSQAREFLLQALTLARPEGYRRLFLDEGQSMNELLRAVLPAIRDEQSATYARELLHALDHERAASARLPAHTNAEPHIIEPLSPQERRVLRLLAAGLSNPEIANELVVSVNTIKTQVQSIYYKLGVNSRQGAREAARKFRLV
jgi:LuxR family maltose regulon positive regulatory protein